MTFGLSGAALAGIAASGATLISGYMQADAAQQASQIQAGMSQAGIDEQRRQFNEIQKLLQPYVQAGTTAIGGMQPFAAAGAPALQQQQALLGLAGPEAQRAAIEQISQSPEMQALTRQGEEAILQRASATGGLRGGNVQAALAQFRPQLLSELINQQYGRLGGLTALGANTQQNIAALGQGSAVGQATAGLQSATNISNLLGQQGAALAGGQLAQGKAFGAIPSAIAGGLGIFKGLGEVF